MSFGQTTVAGATPFLMVGQESARLVFGRSKTPSSAEQILSVRAYVNSVGVGAVTALKVGIYNITGGIVGATKVASAVITIPDNTSAGWVSASLSYSMTTGDEYAYAWVNDGNTPWYLYASAVGGSGLIDRDDSGANPYALASTWPSGGGSSSFDALIEVVTDGSEAEITAIDDPIPAGSSFNFTKFGMDTITSITSNRAGATLSGITNSSATLAGWVNAGFYPELPSTVQFTFGDGTLSANANSNISIPSGYTKVNVVSPEIVDTTYFAAAVLAQTGRTIVTGDRIYHSVFTKAGGGIDALFSMSADTGISCDPLGGTFTAWLWVSGGADAGKMFDYAVTTTESGTVVIAGGLTAAGLTSIGLTRAGLTSAGL